MEKEKKLWCPAESEKLRRKGKEENRTGHGEGKEAVVPRRERKIEKKRERREPDGAWRRKRSCGAPQRAKN